MFKNKGIDREASKNPDFIQRNCTKFWTKSKEFQLISLASDIWGYYPSPQFNSADIKSLSTLSPLEFYPVESYSLQILYPGPASCPIPWSTFLAHKIVNSKQ